MADSQWDVALVNSGKKDGRLQVTLPRALAISLQAAGFTRAVMSIADDGILLTPYKGERRGRSAVAVTLPETWLVDG